MQKIFLIVGPSGSGKSTLVSKLKGAGMVEAVSVTTRRMRPGEVDGEHYYFVDRPRFEELRAAGELIESVEYNGNAYGMTKAAVGLALARGAGKCVVIVEGHGARQFRAAFPGICETVFLLPPPADEIRRRLEARGDAPVLVEQRLASVAREMIFAVEADREVPAGTPEETFERVIGAILRATRS